MLGALPGLVLGALFWGCTSAHKWLFSFFFQSCDLWSLGVIIYVMLCGYPPFYSKHHSRTIPKDMRRKIMTGSFEFPEEEWSQISEMAKDVVRKWVPSLQGGEAKEAWGGGGTQGKSHCFPRHVPSCLHIIGISFLRFEMRALHIHLGENGALLPPVAFLEFVSRVVNPGPSVASVSVNINLGPQMVNLCSVPFLHVNQSCGTHVASGTELRG